MLHGKYDRKNTFLKDEDGYKTGAHFMKLLVLFAGGYHLLLMKIIELKINYFFTNDKDYMDNYTALFRSIKKWCYYYYHCCYRIRKIKKKDNNSNNIIINHKR